MTQTQPRPDAIAGGRTLRITEIFASIQGEGTRAGRRCAFVRLTGCDLRCRWCDTAYAFTGGRTMPIDHVLEALERFGCDLVCVTGGEPLIQTGVHTLMHALAERGFEVLLETGGHRDVGRVDARVVRIMDLKAPGSGESERNRFENLALLTPRDEVKVVIADRTDYEWARETVGAHDLSGRGVTVLLSPVHGELDPKTLAEWVLEDRLHVRVQLQLHKLIWGAEARGV